MYNDYGDPFKVGIYKEWEERDIFQDELEELYYQYINDMLEDELEGEEDIKYNCDYLDNYNLIYQTKYEDKEV